VGPDATGEAAGGAGVIAGAEASEAFKERNICVKLPAAAGALPARSGAFVGSTAPPDDASLARLLSMETGLNCFASSWDGRENGCISPFDSGVFSACSIRVNSPGLAGAGGGVSAAAVVGVLGATCPGAACTGAAGGGTGEGGGAVGAAAGGAGCPKRDTSKSSSSRAGTVEKISVALEGGPEGSVPGRSAPNESGLSNGLLDALIDDPRFLPKSMVMDTQTTSL
jgi:hypothetical protein